VRLRLWLVAALACVGCLGAAAVVIPAGAAARSATHPKTYPARLLVYAQEYSLQPSRTTLPAGKVIVQLWNRGMDPHDLRIRRHRPGGGDEAMYGKVLGAVKITTPGKVSTATWTLKPGFYELYCSLPGHLAMGMHVDLRVTKG
jgi:plastocyanin